MNTERGDVWRLSAKDCRHDRPQGAGCGGIDGGTPCQESQNGTGVIVPSARQSGAVEDDELAQTQCDNKTRCEIEPGSLGKEVIIVEVTGG